MDKFIDTRFERVQISLAAFIDSIVKNNPSPSLAADLVAADAALQDALLQLERHQNNAARIEALRRETADLDAQIKATIGSLWSMRKEIVATPTTTYTRSEPLVGPIKVEDLLAFARRIAPHSRPPNGAENAIRPDKGTEANTPAPALITEAGDPGPSVRASAAPSAAPTPAPNGGEPGEPPAASQSQAELPEQLKASINPHAGIFWSPWPSEVAIQSGALSEYQKIVNQGKDPKGYDPVEEERKKKEAEEAQKEAEEKQRLEREENERRMREEHARVMAERERQREESLRRGSVATGGEAAGPSAPQRKQFQFMGGLDDDDDDDE